MRTPWPSRSARPSKSALRIESSPSASPACTVTGKNSRREEVEGRRGAGDGGKPASAPAMSKPTTPRSRWRTASSAISSAAVGVAHRGDELADADAAALAARASSMPCSMPVLHRLDGLVEREPAREVLLGRPADLAVDHAVGGEVLDELARDARAGPRGSA